MGKQSQLAMRLFALVLLGLAAVWAVAETIAVADADVVSSADSTPSIHIKAGTKLAKVSVANKAIVKNAMGALEKAEDGGDKAAAGAVITDVAGTQGTYYHKALVKDAVRLAVDKVSELRHKKDVVNKLQVSKDSVPALPQSELLEDEVKAAKDVRDATVKQMARGNPSV